MYMPPTPMLSMSLRGMEEYVLMGTPLIDEEASMPVIQEEAVAVASSSKKKKSKKKKSKKRKSSTAVVAASTTTTSKNASRKGVPVKALKQYHEDRTEAGMGLLIKKFHVAATLLERFLSEGLTQELIEHAGELCDRYGLDRRNELNFYATDIDGEIKTFDDHTSIQKEEFGQRIFDILQETNPRFFVVMEDEQSINGVRINGNKTDEFANLVSVYRAGYDTGIRSATTFLSSRARRYRLLGDDTVRVQVFKGADTMEFYTQSLTSGDAGAVATAKLTSGEIALSSLLTKPRGDITEKG